MGNLTAYIILIIAVALGTAANGFAKSAQGFTMLIPVGITYASFAGLCIIATTIVGVYKFNQMPDIYTLIGLLLIISGVLIVNLLGKTG